MALSADVTVQLLGGNSETEQVFVDHISFAGDAAYAAGGSANFTKYLRDKIEAFGARTILAIVPGYTVNGSGVLLHPVWDRANDKLMVFLGSTGVENGVADLSGITFNMTVLSK